MANATPKFSLFFYRTPGGREPVREWLRGLPQADRHAVGLDLMRVQFRWPIGMPMCRPLEHGMFEVRSSLPSGRIARVLLCREGEALVALHGFIKKTQATPRADLDLALERMKGVRS
jgi:phage-related protein